MQFMRSIWVINKALPDGFHGKRDRQRFEKRTSRGPENGSCGVLFLFKMRTREKMKVVASDRARRENVPRHILLVEFEDRSSVRRKRIREGVWLSVALTLFGAGGERVLAALIESVFGV